MNLIQTDAIGEVVLVDTCVLSYVSKPTDSRCAAYRRHLEGKVVAISAITVGEIYSGIKKNNIGPKRQAEIEERLRIALKIPIDDDVCRKYAELQGLKTESGSPRNLPSNDRWIAACALAHNLRLVTHNKKDFDNISGLVLIHESDLMPLFDEEEGRAATI